MGFQWLGRWGIERAQSIQAYIPHDLHGASRTFPAGETLDLKSKAGKGDGGLKWEQTEMVDMDTRTAVRVGS